MGSKRKMETDTADSKPQSRNPDENPDIPTTKKEEMAFEWSEEKMTTLMQEVYMCRTSCGPYRLLTSSGFTKSGARWYEVYESLVRGREEFHCMAFAEMSDKIISLESLAHREVLSGDFVDDDDETPFRRAMYRAFQPTSICPPPGIVNKPQAPPPIVRRRLANTSGTASTSHNESEFNF